MSFKIFIYYCAVLGGWAALLVWGVNQVQAIQDLGNEMVKTSIIGAFLGLFMGAAVGGLDAVLNASGKERLQRIALCAVIGLLGGSAGGFLGQLFANFVRHLIIVAWVLVGIAIGASIGMYDLYRAKRDQDDLRMPLKKVLNGMLGGLVGGSIGGFCNTFLADALQSFSRTSKAFAFVILGASIGLFIGLAQVFLKEAWLKVEGGFRAGREMMLNKDQITIGRAESCDLGMFGDQAIEKLHARINLLKGVYVVEDVQTSSGTFLNERRIARPEPLHNGDLIRIGNSSLRFGERAKK